MKTKIFIFLLLFLTFGKLAVAGELIAYSHLSDDGYWQIWVMSAEGGSASGGEQDGKNKQQITSSPEDKRQPAWIKEGEAIAFRTNNGELYTIDLNGQNEQKILAKYKTINNPHFSPVRDEIVFARFDPTAIDISDIWVSDMEGKNMRVLTKDNRPKFQPRFSAQGDQIVFVKADEKKQNYHLWVMSSDGSESRQVTDGTGMNLLPDFSPDGRSIVFSSNRSDHNFEIYLLDIASGKVKRLTDFQGLDSSASFSPDGTKIIFVSNRSGNQQVWVMDKNGKNLIQLTRDKEECLDPAWGNINESH